MSILIQSLDKLNHNNVVYSYIKQGERLYIGKTNNLYRRYQEHLQDEYSKDADTLLIFTYDSYLEASLAELYYINFYFPKYNKRDKDLNSYKKSYQHKQYFESMIKEQYYYIIDNLKEENQIMENKKRKDIKRRGIYQVDGKEDKILNFFESQKEALKSINKLGYSGISDAINERDGVKTHYAYGYRWYYSEDLPSNIRD